MCTVTFAAAGTLHVQAAYMTLHDLHAVTATTTAADTTEQGEREST
jgi:hypothetical protein